jgi:hypothetical protein
MRNVLLVIIAVLLVANLLVSLSRPATAEAKREYKAVDYSALCIKAGTYRKSRYCQEETFNKGLNAYAAEGWYYHDTVIAEGDIVFILYH